MQLKLKITLSAILLFSVGLATAAQAPRYAPQTITCTASPSNSTCSGYNQLNLTITVAAGSHTAGVYVFQSGQTTVKDQTPFYNYQNTSGGSFILRATYSGIAADTTVDGNKWQLQGDKTNYVYVCKKGALAQDCPFDNTPFLKNH